MTKLSKSDRTVLNKSLKRDGLNTEDLAQLCQNISSLVKDIALICCKSQVWVVRKNPNIYFWVAIRNVFYVRKNTPGTKEIVGIYVGDRSRQGAEGLWQSLPHIYRQCAVCCLGLPPFEWLLQIHDRRQRSFSLTKSFQPTTFCNTTY